jgi:hypothetical protein
MHLRCGGRTEPRQERPSWRNGEILGASVMPWVVMTPVDHPSSMGYSLSAVRLPKVM